MNIVFVHVNKFYLLLMFTTVALLLAEKSHLVVTLQLCYIYLLIKICTKYQYLLVLFKVTLIRLYRHPNKIYY